MPFPLSLAMEDGIETVGGAVLPVDLNGDARTDLVAARESDDGYCSELAVFLNTSEEGLGRPAALLPLGGAYRLALLSWWQGHLVLAGEDGLLLLEINPAVIPPSAVNKARFVEAYAPIPRVDAPLSAAVADFNGDGRADVAALDAHGLLTIWLAGEDGQPFTASDRPLDMGGRGKLIALRFDRDEYPDLLFMPWDRGSRPRVLRNRRDGVMETTPDNLLPTPPADLLGAPALGDFNRDGLLDVLWPSPPGRIQYAEKGGGWRDGESLPVVRDRGRVLYFSGELCCADFTGDGRADVVAVMEPEGSDGFSQALVLLRGTGDEASPFEAVVSREVRGRIFALSPADFNGDGRIDLAAGVASAETAAGLTILQLGEGHEFRTAEGGPESLGELLDMVVDDIDRDGDLDLIVSERDAEGALVTTMWTNTGAGVFSRSAPADDSLSRALGDFGAANLSLADFTGDGRSDLLAVDEEGNVVLVRTVSAP